MTPDNEPHRARHEAVRAFRLAVATLEDPSPALFADLSVEDCLRDLTQELPLVSFSPFEMLPNSVPAGSPQTSMLPPGPRNIPGASSPQDIEPTIQPPIFSFRHSGRAAQRHPLQRNEDIRGSAAEEDEGARYTGHLRVPGPAPEDVREAPVPEDAPLNPPGAARPRTATYGRDAGPDDQAPGTRGLSHPEVPPNGLRQGLPEAMEGRRSDLPRSDESPLEGRSESGRRDRKGTAFRSESSQDRGSRGPSDAERDFDPDFLTDALEGREINLPEPNLEAYGAIALVGSLAERLLPSRIRPVGDLPEPDVVAHPGEAAALDRSPFAFLDSVHESSIGGLAVDMKPLDKERDVPGVASDHMDAEAFASLINDVLVKQARRHGVDLS